MVTKLVEVLPMVMDMLTISSFVVLVLYKVVVSISSMFGGRIQKFSPWAPAQRSTYKKIKVTPTAHLIWVLPYRNFYAKLTTPMAIQNLIIDPTFYALPLTTKSHRYTVISLKRLFLEG